MTELIRTVRYRSYEAAVKKIVEDFGAVKEGGNISVLTGEAHPRIFNSEEFLKAARTAKNEKGATIRVAAGPVLLTPDNKTDNGLWILQQEGVLEMRHRGARFSGVDRRVVETPQHPDRVHEEVYLGRDGKFNALAGPVQIGYWDFEGARETWPAEVASRAIDNLRSVNYWFNKSSNSLPLFTTARGLRQLINEGEVLNLEYGFMNQDKLKRLPSGERLLRTAG